MFSKISVLKKFAEFKGKIYVGVSFFKVAGLTPETLFAEFD